MPVISIITPVYQAEALLPACIESVLAQTFPDWELLVIDDGSRDGSAAVCDRYGAADARIRVFHKANGGVSSARNLGLEQARGEYLAFLDADDRFEPAMLETLLGLLKASGADTAACAHRTVSSEEDPGRTERVLPGGIYDAPAIREKIVVPLLGERLRAPVFNGFIWRYLYSAQVIRVAGLTFEGAYLEDELFLLEYFCEAKRLAVTETPLYRYYENPASATHRYMADLPAVFSRFFERKEQIAGRYGLTEACPKWRENTAWAGLLIAVGNAFAAGSPGTFRDKQAQVEHWCARPEMTRAVSALRPEGLGRRKQLVATLLRGRHYGLLRLAYQMKNR